MDFSVDEMKKKVANIQKTKASLEYKIGCRPTVL